MRPKLTTIKITSDARKKLKMLAASLDKSMVEVLDRLVTDKASHTIDKFISENFIPIDDPTHVEGAQFYGDQWFALRYGCDTLDMMIDFIEGDNLCGGVR